MKYLNGPKGGGEMMEPTSEKIEHAQYCGTRF